MQRSKNNQLQSITTRGVFLLLTACATSSKLPQPVESQTARPVSRCPPGAALIPSGDIKFFPGVKYAGAVASWTEALADAGYKDTYAVESFCLDHDEVTVGEYFAAVASKRIALPNSTPLILDDNWTSGHIKRTADGDVVGHQYLFAADPPSFLTDGGADRTRFKKLCPIDPTSNDGIVLPTPTNQKGKLAMACVSYDEAAAFCQSRSGRLPTATEWALAARGRAKNVHRAFPWGDEIRTNIAQPANYGGAIGADMPVGSHVEDTSREGVRDLYGNMMEWTDPRPVIQLVNAMMTPREWIMGVGWGPSQDPLGRRQLCSSCTTTTTVAAFGMGHPWLGLDITTPAITRDPTPCDLCDPYLYAHDFRSPIMGFRCAYDIDTKH